MTDTIRHATRWALQPPAVTAFFPSSFFCRFSSIKRNIPLVCRRLTATPGRLDRNGTDDRAGGQRWLYRSTPRTEQARTRCRVQTRCCFGVYGPAVTLSRGRRGAVLGHGQPHCITLPCYIYTTEKLQLARSFVPSSPVRCSFFPPRHSSVIIWTFIIQQHVTNVLALTSS